MDTRLTSMAIRMAPRADRLSFFTRRPPRKMPRQAQGIAVIPGEKQRWAAVNGRGGATQGRQNLLSLLTPPGATSSPGPQLCPPRARRKLREMDV